MGRTNTFRSNRMDCGWGCLGEDCPWGIPASTERKSFPEKTGEQELGQCGVTVENIKGVGIPPENASSSTESPERPSRLGWLPLLRRVPLSTKSIRPRNTLTSPMSSKTSSSTPKSNVVYCERYPLPVSQSPSHTHFPHIKRDELLTSD